MFERRSRYGHFASLLQYNLEMQVRTNVDTISYLTQELDKVTKTNLDILSRYNVDKKNNSTIER